MATARTASVESSVTIALLSIAFANVPLSATVPPAR